MTSTSNHLETMKFFGQWIEVSVIVLVLCVAGTASADSPGRKSMEVTQQSVSSSLSSRALSEIVASELDLGITDDLISKGCRGCNRGGGRAPSRGHHHGGGRINIGSILNVVRSLAPPVVVEVPDPFDDMEIVDIPMDDEITEGPRLPQEMHDPPMHEETPTTRPSSNQLLDQGPGLEQTNLPPSTQEVTSPVPLSVQDIIDLVEQNNRRYDDVINNLPQGIQIASGGPNLPPGSLQPPNRENTSPESQSPPSTPTGRKSRFSWAERYIPGYWGAKYWLNKVWPTVEKPLDWATDQNETLKQVKDVGKALDRLHKDVKDPDAARRRAREDMENKARPATYILKRIQRDAKEGILKNKRQQYRDAGVDLE
jgi:hypothetical protein